MAKVLVSKLHLFHTDFILTVRLGDDCSKTPIIFQVIHFRLAELQTELELLRALTYQAADTMIR